jgi:hypothetical protein
MIIHLSPQRRDDTLTVVKAGNKLTINGELFDFTSMSTGDTVPVSAISSTWFAGDVTKVGNELEVTLVLPVGPKPTPAQAFPETLTSVPDGPVVFP